MTITELPVTLKPWATELAIFPQPLALELGPAIRRLAAAIGPLRSRHDQTTGEPNGFDGIARKGTYERLLISEWLLADELPDEFMRRAATGEHGFLSLAVRQPQTASGSVVLIDTGPSQLGGPRIAALATLIVLARRAAEAGARLSWGIAQSPRGPPQQDIDPTNIHSWLAARSALDVDDEMVAAWQRRLEVIAPRRPKDVWLIGGQRWTGRASLLGASSVTLSDVIDEGPERIDVTIESLTRPTRKLTLELPPANVCVRLLRDPFEVAAPKLADDKAPSLSSNLVFSPNGLKVYARTGGDVVAFPIPNSPRAPSGKPRVLHPRGDVLAVGRMSGKNLMIVGEEGTRLLALQINGQRARALGHYTTEPKVHAPWKPNTRLPLCTLAGRLPDDSAWFVDQRGWLFDIQKEGRNSLGLVARDVAAGIPLSDGRAFIAGELRPSLDWKSMPPGPVYVVTRGGRRELTPLGQGKILQATLNEPYCLKSKFMPLACMVRAGEVCTLLNGTSTETFPMRKGGILLGTSVDPISKRPEIVSWHPGSHTIDLGGVTKRLVAGKSIVAAALDTESKTLAYVDQDELVLYSMSAWKVLSRFQLGAP